MYTVVHRGHKEEDYLLVYIIVVYTYVPGYTAVDRSTILNLVTIRTTAVLQCVHTSIDVP